MTRSFANFNGLFWERYKWRALFFTSAAIAVFLAILVYLVGTTTSISDHQEFVDRSAACTLFVSALGSDSNSGADPSVPKSFVGAARETRPGSVVCLLSGAYGLSSSFLPPAGGRPGAWIIYKAYGDGPVNFEWNGPADASPMFKFGDGHFPSGPAYLEFEGFTLNGKGKAADGFFCRGAHHLRFIANAIFNTGGSGIGSIDCDYLMADRNIIHHNGYIPPSTTVPQWYSWTSAISFNSMRWFDRYPGFHNIIADNIVTDEIDQSPHHTDGNGIILDLSNGTYNYRSADTPPALVVNNIVYGVGGRCLEAFTVTNFWFVNNTCYMNGLDSAMKDIGSITTNNSRDGYIINNIVVSSRPTNPAYDQQNSNADIRYFANLYFGAPSALKDSSGSSFLQADPRFVKPPVFDPKSDQPYEKGVPPSDLGLGLSLQTSSPALRRGIDPAALPHIPRAIQGDLKKYVYSDIAGNPRPEGGPFDLGAYQISVPHKRD